MKKICLLFAFLFMTCGVGADEIAAKVAEIKENQSKTENSSDKSSKESPAKPLQKEMVLFHGEELFEVSEVYSISAKQRSRTVTRRLKRFANSPTFRSDALYMIDNKEINATIIFSGEQFITAVWSQDALNEEDTRVEIAERWMEKISWIIDKYREDHTIESIVSSIIYALVATALFIVLVMLIRKFCNWQMTFWERRLVGRKLLGVVESESVVTFNKVLTKYVRFALLIWLFIVYLNFVLSFFPWTFNISAQLYGMLSTPFVRGYEAFIGYLPNIFTLSFILGMTYLILKFVHGIFLKIEQGQIRIEGFYPDWAPQTYMLVRLVLITFAGVAAFPYLPGSGSPAFKGISLFVGVLLSLGSTSAVSNIFAGLVMTYMRPFSAGDYVEVNGVKGVVLDRRTFSMRIKTPKNVIVTLPNSQVAGNHIINYSRRARKEGGFLHTSVTIGYDVPWRLIHDLLINAAMETEGVKHDPEPFVLQSSLEDFYVKYELNVASETPELWPRIHSTLHQKIQDLFAEADVEIMSPHYRHNRTGNETTIPQVNKEQ